MKFDNMQNGIDHPMEFDDLKIKSHLNTSLELSGISVSEDLINRTLAAIKEQKVSYTEPENENNPEDKKKVVAFNRYIRGFAGVAAAALIVAIGYGTMRQTLFLKNKSSDDSAATKTQYNMSMESTEDMATGTATATEAENRTAAMEEESGEIPAAEAVPFETADAEEEAPLANGAAGDMKIASTEDQQNASTASEAEDDLMGSELAKEDSGTLADDKGITSALTTDATILAFRDIFLSDPAQAYSVTINDDKNNNSVTLLDQSDISEFYQRMDQHQFISGTEEVSEQDYTVEVKNLQNGSQYIMLVGDHITVHYAQGDTSTTSFYDESGDAYLKQDLEAILSNYSN